MKYVIVVCLLFLINQLQAQKKLIVDASGNGNFLSIQAAINSLTDSAVKPRTIFIKKGIYKEKIFLSKHNVVLEVIGG